MNNAYFHFLFICLTQLGGTHVPSIHARFSYTSLLSFTGFEIFTGVWRLLGFGIDLVRGLVLISYFPWAFSLSSYCLSFLGFYYIF